MKALYIDDQQTSRNALQKLVAAHCPEITEWNEASSVSSGLKAIADHQPDLVFLDVELGEETGMDLLSNLEEINFELVFVTAFNRYAVEAFRFAAIDFLLKPVHPAALIESVARAHENAQLKQVKERFEVFQIHFRQSTAGGKIVLKDQASIYFVPIHHIEHCKANGSYTEFHLHDNTSITVSNKLKEYQEILEPLGFIRTHHSHLVNAQKVVRMDRADMILVMESGDQVPVSSRKKELIMRSLKG